MTGGFQRKEASRIRLCGECATLTASSCAWEELAVAAVGGQCDACKADIEGFARFFSVPGHVATKEGMVLNVQDLRRTYQ